MTRRPATTLIEVLVTLFIMAIGLLALMVLFPLGAINMGHALQDDRCASTASMAENVAVIWNIRHDPNVLAKFNGPPASNLVYIDPNGVIQGLGTVGSSGIPRVEPSFITSSQLADRWFSLPDDIKFSGSGLADTSDTGGPPNGIVERGRRYSFAYLARKPLVGSPNLIDLVVVVYSNRPVGAITLENTVAATVAGTNGLAIGQIGLTLKRGGWILDSSGNFYRVTNLAESGTTTVIDVSPDLSPTVLAAGSDAITIMDYVAEVFDKGTSWQP